MTATLSAHTYNETFDSLIQELEALREDVVRCAESHGDRIDQLPEERRASARNLLRYMALRNHDLRPLQERLARIALSSIGRVESNVLATLDAVLHNLYILGGREPAASHSEVYTAFEELFWRLDENSARLLGPRPKNRRVRIMVTMPETAASDYMMIHQLVEGGMDTVRINCARGGPENWSRIIEQKRYAERVMKRQCRVLMDLRGPKMRTGSMQAAPPVQKVRPRRDAYGKVLRPARIWLTADPDSGNECGSADACLAVSPNWLSRLSTGNHVRLRDARGSKRRWNVLEVSEFGCWAESDKTCYLGAGTVLKGAKNDPGTPIEDLPEVSGEIRIRSGDRLVISAGEGPGRPALIDGDGTLLRPGQVSLPVPEVYRDVRPGESISFDDGRISGIVEKRTSEQLLVRITHTRKAEEKLGPDKGINLPDTRLDLPALSDEDIADLPFVADHADMIGLSFTNTPDDVRTLRERLLELGHDDVAVVVKIETKRGFNNLPAILLEALKFPACGVMIARGDLAAECGFERMAELQEEILWICEAAHVPVIWATQVLEGLTKRGHASRAEITDAAMAQHAECVMLNKGPHIVDAVRTLNDILQRMQDHQSKKRSMMRKLSLAADFAAAGDLESA